ncbi:MAG: AI-2E family transporter [Clostridia bacterium]|nr:AI-2E family transporter [Clostridia bacterium]
MNTNLTKSYWLYGVFIAFLILMIIHFNVVIGIISAILSVLSPLFIGIAIAFILKGPQQFFHKLLKKVKKPKIRQGVSVLLTYISVTIVIALLLYLVIPRLIDSVQQLIDNMSIYQDNLEEIFNDVIGFLDIEKISFEKISEAFNALPEEATNFFKGVFPEVFDFTTGLIVSLMNGLLGLILSIYILLDSKRIKEQYHRISRYLFSKEKQKRLSYYGQVFDKSFSNFIKGQTTEVIILGILTFIGMVIFGFSYPLLISVIIAVSSFVPIVGPIIGLVPSVFLLLMINPMEALYFLMFIIVLQQIEGNLIYPKVVGENVGLPPMFVLLAIIIGGGLFGILGMLIGVPTMSACFVIFNDRMKDKETPSQRKR